MRAAMLVLVGLVAASQSAQTRADSAAVGPLWTLAEQDGMPFQARATLTWDADGRGFGQAPCNRYTTSSSVPCPDFAPDPILATRMACPDLAAENDFFTALRTMTQADVSADTLVLRNAAGAELVFKASD